MRVSSPKLKFPHFETLSISLSKYSTWDDGGMHSKCLHCNVDLTDLTNKLLNQFKVQFLALQSRYPRVVCLVLFIVINLQKYEEKLSTNNDNGGCDDNNDNENNDNDHSAKNISKFNITKIWSCRSQFPSSIDMYQLQTTVHVIFSVSVDKQWRATLGSRKSTQSEDNNERLIFYLHSSRIYASVLS